MLEKWNGTYSKFQYQIDEKSPLYIDTNNNTIYYMDENKNFKIWCTGSRLQGHLQNLWNITRGKSCINLEYLRMTGKVW